MSFRNSSPERETPLRVRDSQQLAHFLVKKAPAGAIGLNPLPIDHKLRNGPLANILHDFVGGVGITFDIDLVEGNIVLFQEILGLPAITAPEGGIDRKLHASMVASG